MLVRTRWWSLLACSFALSVLVSAKETVQLPMRDGVKLATDIHRPDGETNWPVIFARTPYDKNGLEKIGAEAAARDYVFVAQDCRGRFASEGENLPFFLDTLDGADTVAWILKQPWCNGKIGTWGGSAGAITQFQMLAGGAENIAAQHLVVGAPRLYDVVYINGVFRKSLIEDWLRLTRFSSNALPLWVSHQSYDDFWRERDATRFYAKANSAAVHIGGYWDIFAQATIDAFVGYQEKGSVGARGKQKLFLGPWTHGVFQEKAGDLTFPNGKTPPTSAHDAWKWFDYTLKNKASGLDQQPAVTYYVMGDVTDGSAPGNVWRTAAQWPPVPTVARKYYLHHDHRLSVQEPAAEEPLNYVSDPANPVPTVGGPQLTIPAGPIDQRKIEDREDVLVFTSEVLQAPVEITGRVRARLWISADAPDVDLIGRFCDVYPDGRSFNICEGALRARYRESAARATLLEKGKVYGLDLDLWTTSIIVNRGHRLRFDISSTSSPGYDPNPQTGSGFRENAEMRKATVQVYLDPEKPSHLVLPVAR